MTQQNLCMYFCQVGPWITDALECGLPVPDVPEPDYTATTEELHQMALATASTVDSVWVTAANGASVDASTPTYGCKALIEA